MLKHTPGGYRVVATSINPAGKTRTTRRTVYEIENGPDLCTEINDGECEANERLFEAAPFLLTALEMCVSFIENGEGTDKFFECREAWREAFGVACGDRHFQYLISSTPAK